MRDVKFRIIRGSIRRYVDVEMGRCMLYDYYNTTTQDGLKLFKAYIGRVELQPNNQEIS